MSEVVERVARVMREHWYAYQIGGRLGGDLYVTAKAGGAPLAGPFKTMEEAELGRDCVIARAALGALREPTGPMLAAAQIVQNRSEGHPTARWSWQAMMAVALGEKPELPE